MAHKYQDNSKTILFENHGVGGSFIYLHTFFLSFLDDIYVRQYDERYVRQWDLGKFEHTSICRNEEDKKTPPCLDSQ